MQRDIDRDEAVARLLRHTPAGQPPGPGGCVDGEVLAAWSEGALSGPQAATVEAHVAQCARCQALLAAFVRTEPTVTASAPPFWQRWRLQWAVPAAAAATAVTLWIAVPSDQQTAPESLQARADVLAEPVLLEAPVATSSTQQEEARLANEASTQAPPASADLDALADSAGAEPARPAEALGRVNAEQDRPALESAQVAAQADANELATQSGARAQTDEASARLRPLAEEAELAPPTAAAARAPAERRETTVQSLEATPIEIRSPDAARRWRILPGGAVERTTTAGTAWEPAAIEPPAMVTAGASPAPSICWLVGPGGAVLVTTDGIRFDHVPFPEPVDLIGVRATDAQSAVVIAADGSEFQTTDRGGAWTRLSR